MNIGFNMCLDVADPHLQPEPFLPIVGPENDHWYCRNQKKIDVLDRFLLLVCD